jgi:N-methylhydantoinase A/oxoprolinase/acetone carboxylase beta subunit
VPNANASGPRVGVDTGGTFTDLVTDEGLVRKVPSTPADPSRAVVDICRDLAPGVLAHGTTVATNALLERRLGRVALVTTTGFADVIEIARQARPSLYDPHVDRPAPLVPRELRFEVAGRLGADGHELEPFDGVVPDVGTVDTVAVCLLHADLDPEPERAVATLLRARGHDVVCSHEVSPEFREYERIVTTTADAALRRVCAPYLRGLVPLADDVLVMTSAGGLLPLDEAEVHPARLLLSGPAGGVRAAAAVAAACGFADAVAFDMGGTSTDVCLVQGGVPAPTTTRRVAGLPVRLPSLAIHTIGAGGGSIARLDPGGALAVGPESAGADPGPACYGRGGIAATVTDADVVLGRIPPEQELPGLGRLDVAAAQRALDDAGVTAEGVVSVVDAAMARAVRVVTVEQGVDPRDLALLAFGGAGPLHACAVADELGMHTVVVPARAGVFSALGILCAPEQRELVESWPTPASRDGLTNARASLAARATALLPEGEVEEWLDCRYVGQSHELTVLEVDDFPAVHAQRNGYARPGVAVEIVALRARVTCAAPLAVTDLPEPRRASARGPVVVAEPDCTMWVPDGWRATPGPAGAWLVQRS